VAQTPVQVWIWASDVWFGSKKKLLEDFAGSELRDGAAVIVNGYLSNVNIKHVMTYDFHL